MATVNDVYEFINKIAPFNTAEEWDNSGFLIGDGSKKVNKIILALDITSEIVDKAIEIDANLIVTHHPVIFKPVREIKNNSFIYKIIKHDIAVISAHTNYDKAVDGVNDILCNALEFVDFQKVPNSFLNVGILNKEYTTSEFAQYLKQRLSGVVRYNNINKNIKNVAVCSGSGSDFLNDAKLLNCDALLTGDGSHHDFIDASEMDICLFCAGHFETENLAMKPLCEKIKDYMKIECVMAEQTTPVVTI